MQMKNMKFIALFLILMIPWGTMAGKRQINMADLGVTPQTPDCTPAIVKCLQECKDDKNITMLFEKGTYHFFPDFGKDKYCFVSNNDEGLKRTIFLLEQVQNMTIDGQGSNFIFHGFSNPFVIYDSKNVTFKNFSIDYVRPFHSEAIIIQNNPDGIDVMIPKSFPYKINNGTLVFTDGRSKEERQTTVSREIVYPYGSLLEFDTNKRETAFMARDYYLGNTPLVAKDLGNRKVRLFLKDLRGTVGNTLVFASANRNYPGFTVSDSENLRFENITIFHSGGMGIVGQRTHNVTVESCKVTPSNGRMISCTADATHFSNCTGKIELSHCIFENQMDDATNIHGIYVQIARQIAPNEVLVQLKHTQQLGFEFLQKGVPVEFVQGLSLITKGNAVVLEAERINKDFTRVKLSEPLPEGIKVGDAIGELRKFPAIHIHDNYIGKNRARGMLLNCRGKTIVENNIFHSPGAAILFEGDANFWFEQGGVNDCTIRNNVFDNCLFGVWGEAIIDVQAGIKEQRDVSRYNKNIKVYNNTFRVFDDVYLLHAYGVENMEWKNNKRVMTNDYPSVRQRDSLYKIEYCDDIKISEP